MVDFLSSFDTSFETLVYFIQMHEYTLAALLPLVIGEVALFIFGILFGAGKIPVSVLLVGLLVVVLYDVLIFLFVQFLKARHYAPHRVPTFQRLLQKANATANRYMEEYEKRPFRLLLLLKILPFTKVTIFLYALRCRTSFGAFVLHDIGATLIWALVVFLPGILVGREFFSYEGGQKITTFIGVLLAFLIIMSFFDRYLTRFFFPTKKED